MADPFALDSIKFAWQEKYRAKEQLQAASNPEFQLQQGNKFLAQHKLVEAIAYYRRALRLDPNCTQAHQQLAVALKQQGKLTEANRHYRQAIDTRLTTARQNLETLSSDNNVRAIARIYLQQARSFQAQGEWHKAITACQEALDFDPQLAAAYKTWGDSLLGRGNATEAMGYYAKALAIKPDFAEVCQNLGSLSCKQQQWQLAIDYFQQAIAIDARCAEAYRNLARVYKKLNQHQLMLDYWFEALQIEPERASVTEHCNLARIMVEIGSRERAIACYWQALKLQPHSATVYLKLGELLAAERAIEIYQQGLKYLPRHGEINLRLARLLKQHDTNRAIAHYRQAIATQPQDWRAYFYLGTLLAERQQNAAVSCYRRVLQLKPEDMPTYLKLAEVLVRVEQWNEVIRICQQGLKIDSQSQLYSYLGFALLQLQEYAMAIEVYLRGLRLNPEATDSYRNLGIALMAEQRWSEAVSCYQQVLQRDPNCRDYCQLGEAAARAEDWKTSTLAWTKAIEIQSDDPWSYHHLGLALMKLQKWREAALALQQSIDLNPDFSWSYFHLGDALAKQQRWQESSAAYRHFLTHSANGYAYERLGDNLMRQIQPQTSEAESLRQEAESCYYRALEAEPDYLQPYYKLMELRPYDAEICMMLAETYARQQDWATATIFYQIGLGIDPNPQRHFELGIVLEQQQQFNHAITHYRSAANLDPHEPRYQTHLQEATKQQREIEC